MAKFLAWALFIFSSGCFIASLAQQQYVAGYDEVYAKCSVPLPDMLRFQQACAAADAADAADFVNAADLATPDDVQD